MPNRSFKVRYWLQSLQTRSNPLFGSIKAFLLTNSLKRLIADGSAFKDNVVTFQAALEQQNKLVPFNEMGSYYEDYKITILLEFNAEGRFIKMGETQINLADVLNNKRNGNILPYRLEKSYDRNAKLLVGVTMWEVVEKTQRIQIEKGQENIHSRSYCQLPQPRVKTRTHYNKHNTTQYTDRQLDKEEEISNISDKHTSYNKANKQIANRTQIMRKPTRQQSLSHQEILDLRTQSRLYQRQMIDLEQKYREVAGELEALKDELCDCQSQNFQLASHCNELKNQINIAEQSKSTARDQLNMQIARCLKLYQDSEKERNKLLVQMEHKNNTEKDKIKEVEKLLAEQKSKVKQLEKTDLSIRHKIQEYMGQIAIYDKAIKTEQKTRERLENNNEELKKSLGKAIQESKTIKEEKDILRNEKEELLSELQVGKFSIRELEKQLSELKLISEKRAEQVSRYQSELQVSDQAIRHERSTYNRKLHQIELQTEREQMNVEVYMEELEIKTINEQSKNNQISKLKRDLNKAKQSIQAEKQKSSQAQIALAALSADRDKLQMMLNAEKSRTLSLSKEKNILQSQLREWRQSKSHQKQSEQHSLYSDEQERERLICECYEERDQLWKGQLQKLQKDIKLLMEKSKKDKEIYDLNTARLEKQIKQLNEETKQISTKLKMTEEQQNNLKKNCKIAEMISIQHQKVISQLKQQIYASKKASSQLQQKIQGFQDLETTLNLSQKRYNSIKKQFQDVKSQLEKYKSQYGHLRNEVKQLISYAHTYISKSQRHRVFGQELQLELIDRQFMLIFNSSIKLFCQKHNRVRAKLEELDSLKGELQMKEKECERINNSLRSERRSQAGSCDSNGSIQKSESQSTTRLFMSNAVGKQILPYSREDPQIKAVLRRQIEQLKSKLRKETARCNQLQRQIQKHIKNEQQLRDDLSRAIEQSERKGDQINDLKDQLKIKDKHIQVAKQDIRQLNTEISSLKIDLQQSNKALKLEKSQFQKRGIAANGSIMMNRSLINPKNDKQEEVVFKLLQLEKRYKNCQQEVQKLRREKDDRKNGDTSQNRQIKALQAKLKEKESAIADLKTELDEERQRSEQTKQIQSLKLRKMKQQFEQEIEIKQKNDKENAKIIEDTEQKLRQLQKKIKILQESLKSANIQLSTFNEREERNKKIVQNQFELKIKSILSEHQAQLAILRKQIDEAKVVERSMRQTERRRQKQTAELKIQLEKKERAVMELNENLQFFSVRLKNMQDDESGYKDLIVTLEKKMKSESLQESHKISQKQIDKDNLDNKSNFSIRTFTFK